MVRTSRSTANEPDLGRVELSCTRPMARTRSRLSWREGLSAAGALRACRDSRLETTCRLFFTRCWTSRSSTSFSASAARSRVVRGLEIGRALGDPLLQLEIEPADRAPRPRARSSTWPRKRAVRPSPAGRGSAGPARPA